MRHWLDVTLVIDADDDVTEEQITLAVQNTLPGTTLCEKRVGGSTDITAVLDEIDGEMRFVA